MEQELNLLKSRNQELYESSHGLEQQLDGAIQCIETLRDANQAITDEKEDLERKIDGIQTINHKQETMINLL